jgi:hypothetical protein
LTDVSKDILPLLAQPGCQGSLGRSPLAQIHRPRKPRVITEACSGRSTSVPKRFAGYPIYLARQAVLFIKKIRQYEIAETVKFNKCPCADIPEQAA